MEYAIYTLVLLLPAPVGVNPLPKHMFGVVTHMIALTSLMVSSPVADAL